MIHRYLILKFLLLISPGVVISQASTEKSINHQLQFWTSLNSTVRISDHWGIIADAHIRRNQFLVDPSFYFLRFGAAYWINDQFSFAGGAAALWLATSTEAGTQFAIERRLYQQALWRAKISRTIFLQRIRTEQRWQEVLDYQDGSVDHVRFTNRFRFLMSAAIQVFNNVNLPQPVISNELHFQVGKEVIYNTFDQNRFFVGINQQLKNSWSFDFGYMMVYQQKYSGYEYDMNHTIRLFFYYTPDFRKIIDEDLPHYPVSGSE